jgi:peptidoglycan/xylan/chitin deacetylase (PgdA/CDA1 family)
MKLLRSGLDHFAAIKWKRFHKDFLVVFNWHQVSPTFNPGREHEYTWTKLADFETEMDYLAAEFTILPLPEAIERLSQGSLRGACASLTFDDGDASMSEHVWPLLRGRNLPATFFINSAYLDGRRSYWFPISVYLSAHEESNPSSAELKEWALQLRRTDDPKLYNELRSRIEQLASLVPDLGSRLVSPAWLSSLDGEQFSIGAHGHEHQRFAMMPAEWQRNDLQENVRQLSQFKAFRPVFAVPFGHAHDWTPDTLRIARDQKLEVVLAAGGVNVAAGDCYRRIPADGRKLRSLILAAMSGN